MNMSACSHKGKVRSANEDNCYISTGELTYLIVADGMGGHKGGKVASSTVIDCVKSYLSADRMKNCDNIPECLIKCVDYANMTVYKKASSEEELVGMGTTLVMLYKSGDTAYILNVGDSRCYHIRENEIKQITKDHSIVQELFDNGKIEFSDMKKHPNKNIITRAIGTDFSVKCDIFEVQLKDGDGFVLCSDGLSNMLEDEQILKIFSESCDTQECANKLVESANEAGGTDNITVIAAKM